MNGLRARRAAFAVAGHGLALAAGGLGLRLAISSLHAQWHRLALLRAYGLGFADPSCTTGFCDYPMFWLAGWFARHGEAATLYDPVRYAVAAARVYPDKSGYLPFLYPPTMLPIVIAMSHLPLVAGYFAFVAFSVLAAAALLRRAGVGWPAIALGLLSPVAMWNLYLGQFGMLCGALAFYGLALLPERPLRAGAALGLLCIKPQYALLAPFAVLAGRHWRAMAAGLAVGVLLSLLSLAMAGPSAWSGFLGPARAEIAAIVAASFGHNAAVGGTSVFWMLRSLHAPLWAASAVQALAALGAIATCWRLWSRPAAPLRRAGLTVLLGYFMSPYGYNDDLTIYAVILAALLCRGTPWRNAAIAWAWLLPAYMPDFCLRGGFLATPLLVVAALALVATDDYALRSKNSPCSPNRLASARERRQGALAPASSAASQRSTL
jgi:hypothetical protein